MVGGSECKGLGFQDGRFRSGEESLLTGRAERKGRRSYSGNTFPLSYGGPPGSLHLCNAAPSLAPKKNGLSQATVHTPFLKVQ